MKLEAEIKIEDVMTKELVSAEETLPIAKAAQIMVDKGISSLTVSRQGKIVGIITERDFVRWCATRKCDSAAPISRMMSTQLITIEPSADLLQAVRLMGRHRIRHLLVKKGDDIAGIVSLRDMLKILPESIYGYLSQKGAL